MPAHCCTAGLPLRHFSLAVWHCCHCQAFSAHAGGVLQAGGDHAEWSSGPAEINFGPFDSLEDVQRWVRLQWEAWLATLP